MNTIELTNRIKEISLTQAPIKSVYDGDVYEIWNSSEVNFGSLCFDYKNVTYDTNSCTYTIIFYYGDRLLQDKSNTKEIYADGINAIQSVINILNEDYIGDIPDSITYTPFQQQFCDYLAGVYATVEISTDSTIGVCSINDFEYITDRDKLIEDLLEKINEYKIADAELSVLLQSILHKINGESGEDEEQLSLILQEILYKTCGETIDIDVLNSCHGNTTRIAMELRKILYKVDGEVVNDTSTEE